MTFRSDSDIVVPYVTALRTGEQLLSTEQSTGRASVLLPQVRIYPYDVYDLRISQYADYDVMISRCNDYVRICHYDDLHL